MRSAMSRSILRLSTVFKESIVPQLSFAFAASISSHDSERIVYSSMLSTQSLLSILFGCSMIYFSSTMSESIEFGPQTDSRISFPFSSSVSWDIGEAIRKSAPLSTESPLSVPLACSVTYFSSTFTKSIEFGLPSDAQLSDPLGSSVSLQTRECVREFSLLSIHTPISRPLGLSVIDLSSTLTESTESELLSDPSSSSTKASSIFSRHNEGSEEPSSLATETQVSIPSDDSISGSDDGGSEGSSRLSVETLSSIRFAGSIIYSCTCLPASVASKLSIEISMSFPLASSVSSENSQLIGKSSILRTDSILSLLFARSLIDLSSVFPQSHCLEFSDETLLSIQFRPSLSSGGSFPGDPLSISLASSVSSQNSQLIGEPSVLRTEALLSFPFARSVIHLSSPFAQSHCFESSTETSLSVPFASSVCSQNSECIGDTSPLCSGLLFVSSSHDITDSDLSGRFAGTVDTSTRKLRIAFDVSDGLRMSNAFASDGIFDRPSHLPFSGSGVLTATDCVEVSISARLQWSSSSGDTSFPFGDSGFFRDSVVFDASVGPEFTRLIHFCGVSSLLRGTSRPNRQFNHLESSVTLDLTSSIASSSSLSCTKWELRITGILGSTDMANGALSSNSLSVGVVAGSIVGAVVLCSVIGVSLFVVLRSRRKGNGDASAEMDGDPEALEKKTWDENLDCVFENQLDEDDAGADAVETIPRLE
jgi:hypothetical protein